MVWIILMMLLLPVSVFGADLVIPASPPQVEIRDVKYYRVSYGFQEDEKTGSFQLQVNLRYRKWTSRIQRVKHFMFRLQSGTITQRDDQTLVYVSTTVRSSLANIVSGIHHTGKRQMGLGLGATAIGRSDDSC